MRSGTTEPGRSEDLWAQVAATQAGGRTQRRNSPAAGGVVDGRSQRGTRAGAWQGWP